MERIDLIIGRFIIAAEGALTFLAAVITPAQPDHQPQMLHSLLNNDQSKRPETRDTESITASRVNKNPDIGLRASSTDDTVLTLNG